MKYEIETQFNLGDTFWHKNPETGKAEQHTVTEIIINTTIYRDVSNGEETSGTGIIYCEGMNAIAMNIPGKLDENSAYATKEEAETALDFVEKEVLDIVNKQCNEI
jgi:ribosome maturation protein Sdo1